LPINQFGLQQLAEERVDSMAWNDDDKDVQSVKNRKALQDYRVHEGNGSDGSQRGIVDTASMVGVGLL
jgi:hypothetical protein